MLLQIFTKCFTNLFLSETMLDLITKPKYMGGLGLPNFQHYYWAANCRALMYWIGAYPGKITSSTPSWLAIKQDVHPYMPFCFHQQNLWPPSQIFFGKQSLRIWYQIRKTFKLPEISALTPIQYIPTFTG